MRKRRWKAPASYAVAYYHCVSRVVDRQYVLGPEERERFGPKRRDGARRLRGVKADLYSLRALRMKVLD
jgi:hypothetical protein